MTGDPRLRHLLRRAAFGASPDDLANAAALGFEAAVDWLLEYEALPDDVDGRIGQAGYAPLRAYDAGPFSPATRIEDARLRWLFRILHSPRPLQERMTLFWHGYFATGYSKIEAFLGPLDATRLMASTLKDEGGRFAGQIEKLRAGALGRFGDLLLAVATDPAMLIWLDCWRNHRGAPQENFARELLELFTIGPGAFTELDVRSAARVFTGWSGRRIGEWESPDATYRFEYFPDEHDASPKRFTFPIYPDGGMVIPARPAGDGMQDGRDLLAALARHPATADRLALRLWQAFGGELDAAPAGVVRRLAETYRASGGDIRAVMRRLLLSPEFAEQAPRFSRYGSPVEFAARLLKEIGWQGMPLERLLQPLAVMGQQLFDPPDVGGWPGGELWFGPGAMLARMNLARDVAVEQSAALAAAARGLSPKALVANIVERVGPAPLPEAVVADLVTFASRPAGTGAADLSGVAPALVRLVCGSPYYQFT